MQVRNWITSLEFILILISTLQTEQKSTIAVNTSKFHANFDIIYCAFRKTISIKVNENISITQFADFLNIK